MRIIKKTIPALALAVLVPAAALADDRRVRNTTPPPYTPRTDVDFIEALVPHHQAAIEMAQVELRNGTRPEVKAMAQQMIDDQTREIAVMQAEYKALTRRSQVPPPPPDNHMRGDMASLRNATGAAVDQTFLDDMIPHHAGAISLTHRARPFLRRQTLRDLAVNMENAQAAEIGEMGRLKTNP